MSTQPPALPRANSSAAVNSPQPTINSLSDSARTAQAFFEAVRAFTASPGFHGTAELIDEVPRLRKIVAEKDKELKSLVTKLEEQKHEHDRVFEEQKHEHDKISEACLNIYNNNYEKHKLETQGLRVKIETLEAEVRKQKDDIARLHKSDDELMKQGTKLRGLLEAEKDKCEKAARTIELLRKDLEKKNELMKREAEKKSVEMADLAARLRKAEGEASKAKSSLITCHQENVELQKDLEEATERLAEVEGFAEPLSDEKWEASITLLDELWRSAHDLISAYFRKDLPKEILSNTYAWTELKKPLDFSHSIPLPQSNSPCAKSMRIAVILAVLARLIDKYLFQPSYILSEESGLREILIRQAIENSRREAFTRGIFLATFEDEQAEIADELVTRIIKELMHHIHDLLPPPQVESFKARLEHIIQNARDIWWKTQRLRQRLEPDFQVEDYGWEQPIQFQFGHEHSIAASGKPKADSPQQSPRQQKAPKTPTTAPSPTAAAPEITPGPPAPVVPLPPVVNGHALSVRGPDESLLLIFPRIYIVEDDDPEPVTPGTVLLKSQAEEAERELHVQQNAMNNGLPSVGRAASHRNGAGNGVMRVGGPRPRRLSVPQMEEIPEVPTPGEGEAENDKKDFLEQGNGG
ncbi:hypothetical protein GTA08_BOTSDO11869 [Neofusicoccum parvum]|nr:hypothetical protein GTA08_BOTSDO11869 [Neofusicoccum parvum]